LALLFMTDVRGRSLLYCVS